MASESISLSTPPKQHGGRADVHDAKSVKKYTKSTAVPFCYSSYEDFAAIYLQDVELDSSPSWVEFREKHMGTVRGAKVETPIYDPIVALLNWISRYICRQIHGNEIKPDTRCILFRNTHNVAPIGIPGCSLRPDITAVCSTYAIVDSLLNDQQPPTRSKKDVFWHEIVTFVEAKVDAIKSEDRLQAGSYASRVPIKRPEVAGLLFVAVCVNNFTLHWSDASGIVRCPSTSWDMDPTLERFFRFIKTLYQPRDGLPQIDESVKFDKTSEPDKERWRITTTSGVVYRGRRIRSTPAYGRQTFVWRATREGDPPGRVHIVKDCWRDKERRYKESDLYAKARGVRGVAQMLDNEDVKYTTSNNQPMPLETSPAHSGNIIGDGRRVAQRAKERIVMNSTGEPFKKRKSVSQLLKALYDAVQAHQTLVTKKGVLHRDISPNNILINPVHDEECKFEYLEGEKYINQVLNPSAGLGILPRLEALIIDLDNGADVWDKNARGHDTRRTGTRKYISRFVIWNEVSNMSWRTIEHFPELKGRALELYVKAYGQKTYDDYKSEFDSSKIFPKSSGRTGFEHRPHHDAESFIWIIVESLVKAWPEGKKEDMNEDAVEVMEGFDEHEIARKDSRAFMESFTRQAWTNALHPTLSGLAPMLEDLVAFLRTDWRLWDDELTEDFLHEALKRILLREIVRIDDDKADVPLKEEQRAIPQSRATDDSPNNKNVNGKRVSSYVSDSESSDLVIKRGRLF